MTWGSECSECFAVKYQARQAGRPIHIVWLSWLEESLARYERQKEEEYRIPADAK